MTKNMPAIAVIGGCGHVGLPFGIKFAQAGASVLLVDTDKAKVEQVLRGEMPFLERGADEALAEVVGSGRLKATTEASAISDSEVVIVTIGTPLDEFLNPHVLRFERFLDGILERCRPGQLVILRSTVYPGVTNRLAKRLEERGLDVDLANCPERIAQGFALEELTRLPQLIGGASPRATARARALFEALGARCIELPPIESELAKLFANSYRYINFAISNQFYAIAQRFEADFFRIHKAVTTDYPRLAGFASAGFAAGPCLLKDTMQLAAFNHNQFAIGHAAMMVNEDMPSLLIQMAKKTLPLSKMRAAILGMAFKGNNDDHRDSLSYKLRKLLVLECREVVCTDPYIKEPDFVSLDEALGADVIFVGACHREYRDLSIEKPLYDCFNFIRRDDSR